MKTNPKEIGQRIKVTLDKAGLTQRALAEKLKVTDPTVSAYIRGVAGVPTEVLVLVAELGNVSLDWLITGREEQPQAIVSEPMTGYSPDSKIVADMYEMKVEGKTAQERMEYLQKITETIRKG